MKCGQNDGKMKETATNQHSKEKTIASGDTILIASLPLYTHTHIILIFMCMYA